MSVLIVKLSLIAGTHQTTKSLPSYSRATAQQEYPTQVFFFFLSLTFPFIPPNSEPTSQATDNEKGLAPSKTQESPSQSTCPLKPKAVSAAVWVSSVCLGCGKLGDMCAYDSGHVLSVNLCVECVSVCLSCGVGVCAYVYLCIRARVSVGLGVVWVCIASVLVCL